MIKKSLLALTILGAFSGATFADGSMTMYGLLDAGIDYETGGAVADAAGGHRLSLQSGISQASRVGFRGNESLSGNLKLIYQLEAGIQLNNGRSTEYGTLFSRASWLGLSGDFGTMMIGRQFTPLYNALNSIDPFELGMAGNANNLMSVGGANPGTPNPGASNPVGMGISNGVGSMWQNNSLRYVSKDWHGFNGEFNYGFGGQSGGIAGAREIGVTVNYARGPLTLLTSYDGTNAIDNSNKFYTTLVGGSINWGDYGVPVKTSFGYAINKGSNIIGANNVDSRDIILGARFPFGRHEFLGSYVRHDDRTDMSLAAEQFSLGYTYEFTKRTSMYSSIALTNNKNGAQYTLGNASNDGLGRKGFDLGVRHTF